MGDINDEAISPDSLVKMMVDSGQAMEVEITQDEGGNYSIKEQQLEIARENTILRQTTIKEEQILPEIAVAELSEKEVQMLSNKFIEEIHVSDVMTTKLFKKSFTGKDAVSWLSDRSPDILGCQGRHKCSRETAVLLAQRLIETNCITFIPKEKQTFTDDKVCYRLMRDALLDDALSSIAVERLVSSMRQLEEDGGLPVKTEKILLKKHQGVFSAQDAAEWMLKNVPGLNQSGAQSVVKLFAKKGLFHKLGSLTNDYYQFGQKAIALSFESIHSSAEQLDS